MEKWEEYFMTGAVLYEMLTDLLNARKIDNQHFDVIKNHIELIVKETREETLRAVLPTKILSGNDNVPEAIFWEDMIIQKAKEIWEIDMDRLEKETLEDIETITKLK